MQMTRLPRIKVTGQGHVIYPSICVNSISPESFEQLSLDFTRMLSSVNRCAEHMTQLPSFKVKVTVKGFTFELCVLSITPEPFGRVF